MIWVLAALSVVVGSVLAIAQTDIKRMLAYSSIAHAGFILTGLTAANSVGIRAAMFYLIAYAAMTLGAFGVVMLVSARGRGADHRCPPTPGCTAAARSWPLLMTLFLLSLAGIPPTAGFIAKVNVFTAAISVGQLAAGAAGRADERGGGLLLPACDRVHVYARSRGRPGRGHVAHAAGRRSSIPAALTLAFGVFPGLIAGVIEKASVLRW